MSQTNTESNSDSNSSSQIDNDNEESLTQALSDNNNNNDEESLTQILSNQSNDNDNDNDNNINNNNNNEESLTQALSDNDNNTVNRKIEDNNWNEPAHKKQKIGLNSNIQDWRQKITSSFTILRNQIDQTLNVAHNNAQLMCSSKKKYEIESARANANQEKNQLLKQQIMLNHQNFLKWCDK